MNLQHPGAAFVGTAPSVVLTPPPAATTVLRLLDRLAVGSLHLVLPDGSQRHFGSGLPRAEVAVHHWGVFAAVLKNGDIGFGESYMNGEWSTPDLVTLLEVMVANRAALDDVVYGHWLGRVWHRLRHFTRRNSRAGSRRNIHAHYDLGNSFYRLWLDRTMTYSSGLFTGPMLGDADGGLEASQRAKCQRVLAELALPAGSRVLEIGCGWGGFAEAAARAGLQVTGLTLSAEQLAWARDRLAAAGLAARSDLRFEDYRDHAGQYDGIASIEMFEAVGEAWWPTYFERVRNALKPGGRAVIQTITIADELFGRYRTSSDFIQQYIFPGGMLPSPKVFAAQARRAGLRVVTQHAFGLDYGRTLHARREVAGF